MKKNLTLILLLLLAKTGFCCTCIQLEEFSVKTEFKNRDVIFHGTLKQVDTVHITTDTIFKYSIDEIWYTFEVIGYFKGNQKAKTIRIRSGITNADDCKFVFTPNESYLVYSNHPLKDNFKKDRTILETNVCTHTGVATTNKIEEAKKQR